MEFYKDIVTPLMIQEALKEAKGVLSFNDSDSFIKLLARIEQELISYDLKITYKNAMHDEMTDFAAAAESTSASTSASASSALAASETPSFANKAFTSLDHHFSFQNTETFSTSISRYWHFYAETSGRKENVITPLNLDALDGLFMFFETKRFDTVLNHNFVGSIFQNDDDSPFVGQTYKIDPKNSEKDSNDLSSDDDFLYRPEGALNLGFVQVFNSKLYNSYLNNPKYYQLFAILDKYNKVISKFDQHQSTLYFMLGFLKIAVCLHFHSEVSPYQKMFFDALYDFKLFLNYASPASRNIRALELLFKKLSILIPLNAELSFHDRSLLELLLPKAFPLALEVENEHDFNGSDFEQMLWRHQCSYQKKVDPFGYVDADTLFKGDEQELAPVNHHESIPSLVSRIAVRHEELTCSSNNAIENRMSQHSVGYDSVDHQVASHQGGTSIDARFKDGMSAKDAVQSNYFALKPRALSLFRLLQKFKLQQLYHVTHYANTNQMIELGIFSYKFLESLGLAFEQKYMPRLAPLYKMRGVTDYVHLNLFPERSFYAHLIGLRQMNFFLVSPIAALLTNNIYSDRNILNARAVYGFTYKKLEDAINKRLHGGRADRLTNPQVLCAKYLPSCFITNKTLIEAFSFLSTFDKNILSYRVHDEDAEKNDSLKVSSREFLSINKAIKQYRNYVKYASVSPIKSIKSFDCFSKISGVTMPYKMKNCSLIEEREIIEDLVACFGADFWLTATPAELAKGLKQFAGENTIDFVQRNYAAILSYIFRRKFERAINDFEVKYLNQDEGVEGSLANEATVNDKDIFTLPKLAVHSDDDLTTDDHDDNRQEADELQLSDITNNMLQSAMTRGLSMSDQDGYITPPSIAIAAKAASDAFSAYNSTENNGRKPSVPFIDMLSRFNESHSSLNDDSLSDPEENFDSALQLQLSEFNREATLEYLRKVDSITLFTQHGFELDDIELMFTDKECLEEHPVGQENENIVRDFLKSFTNGSRFYLSKLDLDVLQDETIEVLSEIVTANGYIVWKNSPSHHQTLADSSAQNEGVQSNGNEVSSAQDVVQSDLHTASISVAQAPAETLSNGCGSLSNMQNSVDNDLPNVASDAGDILAHNTETHVTNGHMSSNMFGSGWVDVNDNGYWILRPSANHKTTSSDATNKVGITKPSPASSASGAQYTKLDLSEHRSDEAKQHNLDAVLDAITSLNQDVSLVEKGPSALDITDNYAADIAKAAVEQISKTNDEYDELGKQDLVDKTTLVASAGSDAGASASSASAVAEVGDCAGAAGTTAKAADETAAETAVKTADTAKADSSYLATMSRNHRPITEVMSDLYNAQKQGYIPLSDFLDIADLAVNELLVDDFVKEHSIHKSITNNSTHDAHLNSVQVSDKTELNVMSDASDAKATSDAKDNICSNIQDKANADTNVDAGASAGAAAVADDGAPAAFVPEHEKTVGLEPVAAPEQGAIDEGGERKLHTPAASRVELKENQAFVDKMINETADKTPILKEQVVGNNVCSDAEDFNPIIGLIKREQGGHTASLNPYLSTLFSSEPKNQGDLAHSGCQGSALNRGSSYSSKEAKPVETSSDSSQTQSKFENGARYSPINLLLSSGNNSSTQE